MTFRLKRVIYSKFAESDFEQSYTETSQKTFLGEFLAEEDKNVLAWDPMCLGAMNICIILMKWSDEIKPLIECNALL